MILRRRSYYFDPEALDADAINDDWAQALNGDKESLARVSVALWHIVCRVARKVIQDQVEAEFVADRFQEQLRTWWDSQELCKFDKPIALAMKYGERRACDQLRLHRLSRRKHLSDLSVPDYQALDHQERSELLEHIEKQIASLPADERRDIDAFINNDSMTAAARAVGEPIRSFERSLRKSLMSIMRGVL